MTAELWRLTAGKLASLIRARTISAREAALAGLARLDTVNPSINAVIDHRPDEVLAEADAIDRALAGGNDPGLLAGVPVTVKVNIDQEGFATTNGVTLQRDLIAQTSSPVVDNLRRAGAVILGRTNTPAFSLRWFTSNQIHGKTRNPRDPGLTPGGSSGGAAASAAAGVGWLAHGSDIAGSIRYPAYACGIHGLRPSLGRVAAHNGSGPERPIGAQLTAVSGPIGRSINDLRIALTAMAKPDPRDPWWVPAPLEGPQAHRRAALCLRPDGLQIAPEIETTLLDAARRLEADGWSVDLIEDVPGLGEASTLQAQLWIGSTYAAQIALAERENDPGALAVLGSFREQAPSWTPDVVAAALARRTGLIREWQALLERFPVLLLPVSAELPFADDLDLQGEAALRRVWRAQLTQIALPLLGLPALSVATGLSGTAPVGVQIVAGRFREDLCLLAGESIERAGVPAAPVTPAFA